VAGAQSRRGRVVRAADRPARGSLIERSPFAYYDTLGVVTANPAAVSSIAITLRTESYKKTYVGSTYVYQRDSLATKVALRN